MKLIFFSALCVIIASCKRSDNDFLQNENTISIFDSLSAIPDMRFFDRYDEPPEDDFKNHPCRRDCRKNTTPMDCYYSFNVEMFSSMSKACYDCPHNMSDCFRPHCIFADGVQKVLYTVNRQMPGPTIEVCLHDTIIVNVTNNLQSEVTTIHWHGFKQIGTPYMDGVPYVTQCPILLGHIFTYKFKATESGTFFWHSHIGNQRSDGLNGALIIHPSDKNNPHKHLYDFDDQVIIVNEWSHVDGNAVQMKQYYYEIPGIPNSMLVNGMGRYKKFERNETPAAYTPVETFNVTRNKRYRFRMINVGAKYCPIEMSVDNHTMTVISLDSNDIEPVEVDAITIWPGERVDFVINANQKPGNYWIRFHGYGLCAPEEFNNFKGIAQGAILHYNCVKLQDPLSKIYWEDSIPKLKNRVLNLYQERTNSSSFTSIDIPNLKAIEQNDESLIEEVEDENKIYITFDIHPIDNHDFHRRGLYGFYQVPGQQQHGTLQFNHISLKLQPFPLLSQPEMIKPNMLCNNSFSNWNPFCFDNHCACTHVISLKLNSVYELILVDEGNSITFDHPLHLHGHFFRVISSVNLEGNVTIERVKELDRKGLITRQLNKAPLKDTMKVPSGGFTIIRIHANNPGYWFFHCHVEVHSNVGMALIFKVGEHHDFPPKPKNFPTCGNFILD